MNSAFYIIIPTVLCVIAINILVYRHILNVAKRKIIADLTKLDLKFIRLRNTKLFDTGDFKDTHKITVFSKQGQMSMTHYKYLDFKASNGQTKSLTIKIDWHLLKKTEISYSNKLEKYAA